MVWCGYMQHIIGTWPDGDSPKLSPWYFSKNIEFGADAVVAVSYIAEYVVGGLLYQAKVTIPRHIPFANTIPLLEISCEFVLTRKLDFWVNCELMISYQGCFVKFYSLCTVAVCYYNVPFFAHRIEPLSFPLLSFINTAWAELAFKR